MAIQKLADTPDRYRSPEGMTNKYQMEIISMGLGKLFVVVSLLGKTVMAS
jgi:hypothetical protein